MQVVVYQGLHMLISL